MSDERSALSASDARRLAEAELGIEAILDVAKLNRDDYDKSKARILEDRANAVATATSVTAVDQRPVTVNNIVDELMARMQAQGGVQATGATNAPAVPRAPEPSPRGEFPDPTPPANPNPEAGPDAAREGSAAFNRQPPNPNPTPDAQRDVADPFSQPSRAGGV